jgi:hypothetical protein
MRSPVVSPKVKYKDGLGIPGRRSTLQREGTMCDSGVTEGSTTKSVARVSPIETRQHQHLCIQLAEYLIGRVILM